MNNFLLGGVENFILELIKKLDKNKYQISVISIMGGGTLLFEFNEINIPIFFAGPKNYPNSLFSKILWIFSLPIIIVKLVFLFQKVKPELIINSMYKADILTYFSCFCFKAKIISIQHDMIQLNPLITWIKQKALKKTDKIIAISNCVKDFLINYFKTDPSKIEIIYNGVDFNYFSKYHKSSKEWVPVFGTIARLDKVKGHIYLFEAIKKIRDKNIGKPKFIFVGDGSEKEKINFFIKNNRLENIEMVGEKKEIGEYMRKIDVFILPSLSEGLGVSIIEALTAGKLVIASNIGGIKELIHHRKTGILFSPGNSNSIFETIKWILQNKKEAIALKEKSWIWIKEKKDDFDISNVAKKYSLIFEELEYTQ